MKSTLFFLFTFFLLASLSAQPGIIWDTPISGVLESQAFVDPQIHYDPDGNILILQHQRGTNGNQDIWLIKLSPDGEVLWDAVYDGAANLNDEAYDLTVDVDGNIYIHGTTETNSTGGGLLYLEIAPLTLKFDADGNQLWDQVIPVAEWFYSPTTNSIIADHDGNCYVTGGIRDTTDTNFTRYFVKYDVDGNVAWEFIEPNDTFTTNGLKFTYLQDSVRLRTLQYFEDTGERFLYTTNYDLDGNILSQYTELSAQWYSTVNQEEDDLGNFYFQSGKSIFKYNQFSESLWQYDEAPTGTNSQIFDIAIDDEYNVYLTGGNEGMYTLKLDKDGNVLWKTFNPRSTAGRHLDVDEYGNTIVGCYFYETGVFYINLVKYDPDGNEIGSIVYANANIDGLKVYNESSFITLIRDFNTNDLVRVQRYDLVLPTSHRKRPLVPLSVFPNPVAEQLFYTLPEGERGEGVLSVHDMNGRIQFQQELMLGNWNNFILPDLANGIYLFHIVTNKTNYGGKFVVAK